MNEEVEEAEIVAVAMAQPSLSLNQSLIEALIKISLTIVYPFEVKFETDNGRNRLMMK